MAHFDRLVAERRSLLNHSTDSSLLVDLQNFLMGCRAAYNSFVLYHNFRHVVDVLQAVFFFLLRLGTLPPYPPGAAPSKELLLPPLSRLCSNHSTPLFYSSLPSVTTLAIPELTMPF